MRIILFYIFIIPITIYFAITGLLFAPLPANIRYWYISRWSHIFIYLAKTICDIKYNITGIENLKSSPAIVIANHQSMWETVFMQVLLPPQSWVLKKQLLRIPFFGWGLALLNPIAIDRTKFYSVKELITKGAQRLAQGRWVVIFPQGTRVRYGTNKKFNKSGAALAHATQTPIIPIAHNAGKFWPKGFFPRKSGTDRKSVV